MVAGDDDPPGDAGAEAAADAAEAVADAVETTVSAVVDAVEAVSAAKSSDGEEGVHAECAAARESQEARMSELESRITAVESHQEEADQQAQAAADQAAAEEAELAAAASSEDSSPELSIVQPDVQPSETKELRWWQRLF